ncbi:Hypothetical protein D9617_13g099750 [Elsinoe fawcettii]|nr:Hypothetical protein D9617_13g099750 [Elsinoe fawcettii]
MEPQTILLVPGAWHPWPLYQPLLSALQTLDNPVHPLTNLSVSSPDAEDVSVQDDAAHVHSAIAAPVEQGKEVVVLCHSYGGAVGTTGATGLTVDEVKATGKEGGPRRGVTFFDLNEAMEAFYAPDVEPEVAKELIDQVMPQSLKSFESPAGRPVWVEPEMEGRLGYIKCLRDKALPPAAQEGLIQMTERKWHVVEIDTGHSPFNR